MTPVQPRDEGGIPGGVVSMIVDGLNRVEESITRLSADVNGRLGQLPNDYVPRREVEHRFDEHTIDIGELRGQIVAKGAKHDLDVEALKKALDLDRERRQTDRRWVIGTVITVAALVVAVLSLVLTRF